MKKQEFRKELRVRGFEPESESDEENPFAMYVGTAENESNNDNLPDYEDTQVEDCESPMETTMDDINEFVEKLITEPTKKLTVIDPGPSTSKSSNPWIGDEDDKDSFSDN